MTEFWTDGRTEVSSGRASVPVNTTTFRFDTTDAQIVRPYMTTFRCDTTTNRYTSDPPTAPLSNL